MICIELKDFFVALNTNAGVNNNNSSFNFANTSNNGIANK
jgi:hypothetical protein